MNRPSHAVPRFPTTLHRTAASAIACLAAAACAIGPAVDLGSGLPPSTDAATAAPPATPPQRNRDQPKGRGQMRFAYGEAEIDVGSGTNLKSDTDAFWWGGAFEGGTELVGGGVQFGLYLSDDDLLEDTSAVDTAVLGIDVFPHFTVRPAAGPFRMPVRVGPHFTLHSLDIDSGSVLDESIEWIGVGGAVEIEPEIDFFRNDRSAMSLYGRFRAGVGFAYINTDADDYSSDSTNLGAEIGLRVQASRFLISGGWFVQETSYDQSDVENFTFVEETDFTFQGVFVDVGVRW